MRHRMTSSLVGFAVAAGLVVCAGHDAAAQAQRTIYVSATDRDGNAITDLQAADFEVKAGGKRLEVVRAGPAQAALRVALLVADAGTGGFQGGLAAFMRKLMGQAEFSLVSVIVQPEVIVDYTSDGSVLSAGLRRLGVRGPQRGAQLMEALDETIKTIPREGTRPVIVVVRVGAEATTPLAGDDVRERLRKSRATLYVVSTVGAQRPQPSAARTGISAEQAQMQDDETVNAVLNLQQVLGDGSKETGGRHDQTVSTTLIPSMERIADELLNQYALTCTVPEGVKATDRLSVSTKRRGVNLRTRARLGEGM
jgi:hypothetical protein